MYYKSKAFRNAKYLSWIRQQPCVVTGMDFTETDMVAHHVRALHGGGMGLKPSDYSTIPLTAFQHAKLHSMIEKEYYKIFEMDVVDIMRDLIRSYLDSKGIEYDDESDLEVLASVS